MAELTYRMFNSTNWIVIHVVNIWKDCQCAKTWSEI